MKLFNLDRCAHHSPRHCSSSFVHTKAFSSVIRLYILFYCDPEFFKESSNFSSTAAHQAGMYIGRFHEFHVKTYLLVSRNLIKSEINYL